MENRACVANENYTTHSHSVNACIEQAYSSYRISNASINLMQEALNESLKKMHDPVYQLLAGYMKKHIPEETGHDEWFLEDLAVMGVSQAEAEDRIPSLNITTFIGSQYFLIKHVDPVAIMGYLACTETHPPTVDYVNELVERSRLPKEAFNALMHHAILDVQHKQDIIETINNMPLSEKQYKVLELSAFQTYRYVANIMDDASKAAQATSA